MFGPIRPFAFGGGTSAERQPAKMGEYSDKEHPSDRKDRDTVGERGGMAERQYTVDGRAEEENGGGRGAGQEETQKAKGTVIK